MLVAAPGSGAGAAIITTHSLARAGENEPQWISDSFLSPLLFAARFHYNMVSQGATAVNTATSRTIQEEP
ncbi:MAG: hypothetical protein ACOY3O_14525 [Thermodesulfobacteriota bacterium]